MKFLLIFTVIVVVVISALTGCTIAKDRFGIFLVEDKTAFSDAQTEGIFKLKLSQEPIISDDDIIAYHWETYELELDASALEKISNLDIPVNGGRSFVACVGVVRVYLGAFWTPISSASNDGVTIVKPLSADESTITIQLGYPGSDFYKGNDPRGDIRIKQALEVGKLRE